MKHKSPNVSFNIFSLLSFHGKRSGIGLSLLLVILMTGCARMGNPDGGWYDEQPPRVIAATPADKGTNVKSGKVQIRFDEFIKLENATEKVVVSPPQMEQPEIRAVGKRIIVDIQDSLRENTTYTIDFSDAISDNNEGNPLGNYTYSFSTGDAIDTLEVAGTVLNAENLEPVKGILVGLVLPDSLGGTMMRVSRSDSRGHFIIRGIAPGDYCCYALDDQDGNYRFSQRSERMSFSHDTFSPSSRMDKRQDTLWIDNLHIKEIKIVDYRRFTPDDLIVLAFEHENKDRYFLKTERKEPDSFTAFFSGTGTVIPNVRILNAPADLPHADSPFITESSAKIDTITYWLRDTMLVNQDTLKLEMTYETTDSLGALVMQTDTIEVLSKVPYAKRMKDHASELEKWNKQIAKMRKNGKEVTDSIMPPPELKPSYFFGNPMAPDASVKIRMPKPLARFDTTAVHLYVKQDTLWYRAPFEIQAIDSPYATGRDCEIVAEWIPGTEYSLEIDTLAFEDIYGCTSKPYKTGLRVGDLSEYATLFVNVTAPVSDSIVVQLLNNDDKAIRQSLVVDGTAEFYYVMPGVFYLRAFVDSNGNGKWDTGNFALDQQPEAVYYCPDKVECKAKWDITRNWNLTARPLTQQKPGDLIKQKEEKEKKIVGKNLRRANEKGIELPEYLK